MLFAASQNFLDIKTQVKTERRDRSIRQALREEIRDYDTLKVAWGLGHIQCKFTSYSPQCLRICRTGHVKNCPNKFAIIGHYRDHYELTKQDVYLGRNFKHAHSRLNHVKSFL